ncbi:asparaginase domain-containing protein [Treponema primitia]|nr:asparaginase domain-containing protein [Treponema primitia]
MPVYKTHISLEVRILLHTAALPAAVPGIKTFCACAAEGEKSSCPVCRGEKGAIPVLNPLAARKAYLLIRSLGCSIVKKAPYERNLNIPPIPQGSDGKPTIALSGLSITLGVDGALDILFHRRRKRIRITEVRLEEDAGRLTHSNRGKGGQPETRMDYSRAGMPSLRIRTAADFEIGEEAEVFLGELRRQIQYLEIMPGNPLPAWENVIRCNAYVAMAPYPENPVNFVKLRNLNSLNFVGKAVNTEMSRQEDIVLNGGTVVPESRLWNEAKNATEFFQNRPSDEKPRFVTEDLLPFIPGPDILEALDSFSVELPEARRNRMIAEYGLTQHQAEFVCDEKRRADYFEKTVSLGTVLPAPTLVGKLPADIPAKLPAESREAAQWMSSYIIKECNRLNLTIADSPLSPERFAEILRMLRDHRIHGSIAKQVVSAVLEDDRDPQELITERGWEQLTNRGDIKNIVTAIITANPQEVRRIREGDARPIQFLTGLIMKETGGMAEPTLVKDILREELSVSLVYVLSMGGAISGRVGEDGAVEAGDEQVLKELLSGDEFPVDASKVRFESIQVGRILSEEIVPSDWAILIETIADRLNSGTANGIVIAHGTDTLPYTAPLIYWLFADANAPIVFAASSTPPGASSEAKRTMKKAVALALGKSKGVYVVHGGKVLSPLNLKFEHIGVDGFRNWNMETPVFSGTSLLTGTLEADQYVLAQLLEDAINSMCVIRIYPGLRADYLVSLMDKGVKNFFLELYDTGTAGFREGPYSLKRAFTLGKRRGTHFYCSSQQEGIVDFTGYTSSRELWRVGAVPMGAYTTETAVARYLAASIIADSEEELTQLMDSAVFSAGEKDPV